MANFTDQQFTALLDRLGNLGGGATAAATGLVSSGRTLKLTGYPAEKAIQLEDWLDDCETRLHLSKTPTEDWTALGVTWSGTVARDLLNASGSSMKDKWEESTNGNN